MSMREQLHRHRTLASLLAIAAMMIAAAIILIQISSSPSDVSRPLTSGPRAFFSIDDGKTWFIDSSSRVPPFNHNGQTAVKAHVFAVPGDDEPFVVYLERYTPEAVRIARELASSGQFNPAVPPPTVLSGIEIKRPGDTIWVRLLDRDRSASIVNVERNGRSAQPVLPDD